MQLLLERGSCRTFEDRDIPADVLQTVLEAGVHAATGGNLQPYSIIQIQDLATRQALAEKCGQGFIARAPTSLMFCLDWYRLEQWARLQVAPCTASSSFRHFWISFQDTVICAQNICTAADAMGLGSVYIGTVLEFFDEIKEMLGLPQKVFPVVLLCLGYPKDRPVPRRKLGVDVIVHSERYRILEDPELLDAFERKYPGYKIEVTPERIEQIAEVCRQVHGEAFAQACVDQIRGSGYINAVQRYFGLHYRANEMPLGNSEYLETMERFGFHWFREFQLLDDASS
jgi:FMN reductase [NAD(P)H]